VRLPPDGRPSLAALAARRLALSRAAREEAARGLAVSRPSQRHGTGETAPDAESREAAENDCLTVSPPRDETVRLPAGAAGAGAPGPERRVGTADPERRVRMHGLDPVAVAEREGAAAKVAARAAALARAADDAADALAAPDPDLAHERQVIAEALAAEAATPPLPEPQHRAAVDAHLAVAMQRPPAWANVSLTPAMGAWCSCCRGRRWWRERVNPTGWRCWTCHGPWHLTAADVVEVRT
jgi:hypothetical protein